MFARFGKLVRDDRGATAVEYGLVLALVVLVLLSALQNLAGVTTKMWNDISEIFTNA